MEHSTQMLFFLEKLKNRQKDAAAAHHSAHCGADAVLRFRLSIWPPWLGMTRQQSLCFRSTCMQASEVAPFLQEKTAAQREREAIIHTYKF